MLPLTSRFALFMALCATLATGCTNGPTTPAATSGCRAVKTGTFVFRPQGGRSKWSYVITRTDSLQTEVEQPGGGRSVLAVKWLNDCTYQVRLVSSTIPYPDSIQQLRKTSPLTTEILRTTDRYYVFRAQRAPTDAAFVDTLWRQP
jgi:hypothetical protein